MNPRVRTVEFRNAAGVRLHGILHEPLTRNAHDTAIVLLPPGVKTRVGPHRLYVKMAEAFAAAGYPVLRFDFSGIGDSEGSIGERYLADYYGSVAVGRYIGDTRAALDWLKTQGIGRAVLGGLCGGAITGVLAAQGRRDVAGIIGLGLPITVDGSHVDRAKYISKGQLEALRQGYTRKLLDPKSWLRFLTFKTDYRVLAKSLLARRRASPPPAATPDEAPLLSEDNTNPHFVPAMDNLVAAGLPVLLLFSEVDRLWWEFEEKYLNRRPPSERFRQLVEIGVVPGANHVFTFDEWQADMLGRCLAWLDRRIDVRTVREAVPQTVSA